MGLGVWGETEGIGFMFVGETEKVVDRKVRTEFVDRFQVLIMMGGWRGGMPGGAGAKNEIR